MFFFYSGKEPISVHVPGEQYAVTINPSERSQKTTNEGLYKYLFSPDFKDKALFVKAESFDPPSGKPQPPASKKEKVELEAKPEGGTE